ncbi:MAG: DNA cytosine methyltransferase [Nostoc sp. NMS7]|uniref:DNA cytosine methyltransferase n=1 Tax=Nostoc sp. NMS7 TaxID=2815391 RepID=UPI0025E16720|nr:DNA cytosine methyltransferase [Nostoc sp. NMS7]MBN3949424.1 DNA cytosine methyltransferase [Nostoc sp. NMS7]
MEAISLFSGIGGFEVALNQVFGSQAQVIQSVEIDPDAQNVLRSHFPDTPIHRDICTYNPDVNWNYTDGIVFGGFPCTDVSNAGKRAGLAGPKSSLWFEMLRIVATARPRFVVVENPTGLIHNGLRAVLGGLRMAGYQWDHPQIISAAEIGAPHQRERLFIVAYPHGWSQDKEQPPSWASQVGSETAIARTNTPFPAIEQRDDGAVYGLSPEVDSVPVSVPKGTPGRIRSRYLYGRSVIPACAAIAFSRVKFLQEWWRDA